jgi:phosphoribosyl 1,2-cyclic phosphodiesterase
MKFLSHYSSSSGNLYTVTAENGARLLIEAGVPWAKLEGALEYDLTGIEACLLSHEHKDHSHAIRSVMGAGIDVYASEETFTTLCLERNRRALWVKDETLITCLDSFTILCFQVTHDVPCLGFVVFERATKEYLLFVTDYHALEQRFNFPFSIIAMACNFDGNVLQDNVDHGGLHEEVGKRIVGSHSSAEEVKLYLRDFCDVSRCRNIYLLHASAANLDREAARREIEEEFLIETE